MSQIDLSKYYKRKKSDRDLFHELMAFKVKEILLVATHYDAYSIVKEGQFSDKIYGEYLQLNLYSSPRFVNATTHEEAIHLVREKHFDMIIIMTGLDKEQPLKLSKAIREENPNIPLVLLVNNNSDLAYFTKASDVVKNNIDNVFVWNGSTRIFMAMIKYVEDKINLAEDIELGDIRIILLVEDSVRYYSRYLPMLYTMIMTQTQNIIADEEDNLGETQKILKMRARPKIILTNNYEQAREIIDKYHQNMLCLITDVRFPKEGKENDRAGVLLSKYLRSKDHRIPILIQSSELENQKKADKLKAYFVNKNSDTLARDVTKFMTRNLGFGSFIFRNKNGVKIAEANTIEEFEECIRSIPEESLIYHGEQDGFSTWLMVRGEVYAAKLLRAQSVADYKTAEEIRQHCLSIFERARLRQIRGRIISYHKKITISNHYVLRLGNGLLGGKGRGLTFISNFIENTDFRSLIPSIRISTPRTAIIGTDEFSNFMEINRFQSDIYKDKPYEEIKNIFVNAQLSETLRNKLLSFIKSSSTPLAVRSSGLFEDSLQQPFAGVYSTYLISNNQKTDEERLAILEKAIKLVYASIFTDSAKAYFRAVGYKIEEEQMAVILQEVVGNEYNGKFYPNISGVAQSYNYYPFSYIKPDDGFAVMAVGLGMAVVGGEKAYRFCPRYPKLENQSIADQVRNTQKYFYAIDLERTCYNLEKDGEIACIGKYDIKEAEKDGSLKYCASTYDYQNDMLNPGTFYDGPRVIDFANILKYDAYPLAEALNVLLDIFKQAMGTPIEIEFSVDLKITRGRPTIHLLQIKPLIRRDQNIEININDISRENIILYATNGMGNGKLENIRDIIYIDIDKFDKMKTGEMAQEIRVLNEKMKEQGREYILIGPGRWGTRDKSTGIPVDWAHISSAKVIVEQGLPNFPLEASLGSHFFHNVISMNIGYYSLQPNDARGTIAYKHLQEKQAVEETTYFRHLQFRKPLTVLMDGKTQEILITY